MSKNTVIVYFFIMIISASSCQNKNRTPEQALMDEWNKKYSSSKSFFNKELTSHFPVALDKRNITFTENISPEMGALELIVIDSVREDSLISLQREYKRNAVGVYYPEDSCLLIVDRFLTSDKFYKVEETDYDKKLIDRPCYSGLYPVPNFWHNDFTTDKTECKLPGDFALYVIRAEQGKFLKEDLLTNGWFMPKQWRNGYSKGVAISVEKRIIFYWLVVW